MASEEEFSSFSFHRVKIVAQRVLKQFFRDKRTFGMMLLFPILFMLVFGMVLSGEVKNVPVSIQVEDVGMIHPVTHEQINLGDLLFDFLTEDERIDLIQGNFQEDIMKIEEAEQVATIFIPANFTQVMFSTGNGTISIYIDGTKPQIKAAVYSSILDGLKESMDSQGLIIDEDLAFGVGELSGLDVSISSVMGYILTFLILLLAVLTAIREDVHKTKLRLFTTPLTSVERILGYVIALTFFAILETSLVLLIAIYIFGATIQGSIGLLFFAGTLFAIAHIFLAFFLSNFAKNEFQSVQMALFVAIPSLALSGMMIPISTFPPIIGYISNLIPLTHGIRIFEGIMLRGWGISELWPEFLITILMTIAFFLLALISSSDKSKE